MHASNQKDFLHAWLAQFLDWLWAFVLKHNKAGKKSVSFSFECQMAPSLLQLVRRGHGHLDAESRSCEILQSPLPCENSTYHNAETSICSGRHLPKSPPPHLPTLKHQHRAIHPTPHPHLLPSLQQPLCLSTKWAVRQTAGGFTFPLTGEENELTAACCDGWRNPPAFPQHGCWIDRSVACAWFYTNFSFRGTNTGFTKEHVSLQRDAVQKLEWETIFNLKQETKFQKSCGNLHGCARRPSDFGSWWAGEQLVGKPSADASRQAQALTASRCLSSHQFPHTLALINVVHLYEIRRDSPVSFHYGVSEQTVMHTGPLLVFHQQVLMLL